jgi:hypothetical protein
VNNVVRGTLPAGVAQRGRIEQLDTSSAISAFAEAEGVFHPAGNGQHLHPLRASARAPGE